MTPFYGVMKNAILFLALISFAFGCKKKILYQNCGTCSCFNVDTFNIYVNSFAEKTIDSTTFYQSLLGTWYLKQKDTFPQLQCSTQCFCDTQYFAIFLPNDSVILNLPGVSRSTYAYSFSSLSPGTVSPQNGCIFLPGTVTEQILVQIAYSPQYLGLNTETAFSGTLVLPPNYYLSRH